MAMVPPFGCLLLFSGGEGLNMIKYTAKSNGYKSPLTDSLIKAYQKTGTSNLKRIELKLNIYCVIMVTLCQKC